MILALLPFCLGFRENPADSTSATALEFGVGGGSFYETGGGCNGPELRYQVPFAEAGIGVERTEEHSRLAVRAGVVQENETKLITDQAHPVSNYNSSDLLRPSRTSTYINPSVGLKGEYAEIDVGVIMFSGGMPTNRYKEDQNDASFTGMLRLGSLHSIYGTVGVFNELPLMSAPGAASYGAGFFLGKPNSTFWIGAAGPPYYTTFPVFRLEYPINESFGLGIRGGGNSRNPTEYGLAIGGKYILR